MERTKDARGITLIALVITVIIMIILGSVIINMSTQNGMINDVQGLTTLYNSTENEKDNYANGISNSLIGYGTGVSTNVLVGPGGISPTGGSIGTCEMGVVEIAWLDMDNNVIEKPLAPNVATGMTPIKWNGTTEATTTTSDTNWYNYQAQTGATDGKTSNWANAKTADGSYWVWIPRYAYKIIYFGSTTNPTKTAEENADAYRISGSTVGLMGYSTVYGIVDTDNKVVAGTAPNPAINYKVKTKGYTDYIPHPAFLGTGYEDLGGGFGIDSKGISGFWVAKFETSMQNGSGTHVETSNNAIGNVGLSSAVKAVSKPGVTSWRYINIANCYENSYNYDRAKESHLIKNSEWGAVAFLAHSKYGRNGTEIAVNDNLLCTTGGGAGTEYATENVTQGTTGNPTGIYDLSGGAYEYVAAFNKLYEYEYYGEDPRTLSAGGTNFASEGGSSTKYATAYSNSIGNGSKISSLEDFTNNGKDVSHVGDAIHEVKVNSSDGWFHDSRNDVLDNGWPFYARGGYYWWSSLFMSYPYGRWRYLFFHDWRWQ